MANNEDMEFITPLPPQLNGQHFRITVVWDGALGFVTFTKSSSENNNDDDDYQTIQYSGYAIDILEAVSKPERGNFTYELLPPSGQGSKCNSCAGDKVEPYGSQCWRYPECAESDVADVPHTNYTTDMFVGAFYITPQRQLKSQFTIPLYPPASNTLQMVGTATYINDFDDLIYQQQNGKQGSVCVVENTAYRHFVRETYPDMDIVEVPIGFTSYRQAFRDRTCDVMILPRTAAANLVRNSYEQGQCYASGMPIGTIGSPLTFGLNYFGFGVRKGIPSNVVDTWNYWLNTLMTCSPTNCDDGLSALFGRFGGTGRECGYVQFPPSGDQGIQPKVVAAIVLACVSFIAIIFYIVYMHKLKKQEQRIKKRFVQQIARNINIGPSPACIPADKLIEEVQHIGNADGHITKEDLLKWMNDIKLEFISDSDFDALWAALDIDGKGEVNPVDFFVFLSACGTQFEQVHKELTSMPKTERLKFAARRLSNINKMGEDGVRALQHRLERNTSTAPSVQHQARPSSFTTTTARSSGVGGGGGGGGGSSTDLYDYNHSNGEGKPLESSSEFFPAQSPRMAKRSDLVELNDGNNNNTNRNNDASTTNSSSSRRIEEYEYE